MGATVSSSHMPIALSSSRGLLTLPLFNTSVPQETVLHKLQSFRALTTLIWALPEVSSPGSKPAPAQAFQGLTASSRQSHAPPGLLHGLPMGLCSTVALHSCLTTVCIMAAGEPLLLQHLLPLLLHWPCCPIFSLLCLLLLLHSFPPFLNPLSQRCYYCDCWFWPWPAAGHLGASCNGLHQMQRKFPPTSHRSHSCRSPATKASPHHTITWGREPWRCFWLRQAWR